MTTDRQTVRAHGTENARGGGDETSSTNIPTTEDVRALYEGYPYPGRSAGDALIDDSANGLFAVFGDDPLQGCRILDAGCGTGQRMLGVARRYPLASVVGLDMTTASLKVARDLAKAHHLRNVSFREGNILALRLAERFDIVISTGVIHHLEDPQRGVGALAARLVDDGLFFLWFYHAIGEHLRLVERELLHALWDHTTGLEAGIQTMEALGLTLEPNRYGAVPGQDPHAIDRRAMNVDAFLHPIVRAYRFDEALQLLKRCDDIEWAAILSMNLPNESRMLDLAECEQPPLSDFCQRVEELFESQLLREQFRRLNVGDKLRVIELRMKPTGFTIVGGRIPRSCLAPRILGNLVRVH